MQSLSHMSTGTRMLHTHSSNSATMFHPEGHATTAYNCLKAQKHKFTGFLQYTGNRKPILAKVCNITV